MDLEYISLATLLKMLPFVFIGIFGVVIGSFLNVCIYRIPRKIFFKYTRSICPECKELIPFYFNIPLLSFFLLRGKSHCCGKKISIRYPIVEGLTMIFALFFYYKMPFVERSIGLIIFNKIELIRFLHIFAFSSSLIIGTFTDLEHKIIPNKITYLLIITGPIISYWHPYLTIKSSLLGIAIGGGVFYLVGVVYNIVRGKVGLGLGDVKLLAGIGGWLGVESIAPTVLISSLLAIVFLMTVALFRGKRLHWSQQIPYGPYLAIGALLHMFLDFRPFFIWIS